MLLTTSGPFMAGVVKEIVSKQSGIYFGTVESAAGVYFLDHGQWLLVQVMD